MARDPFRQAARVDEHQGGAMLLDQLRQALVVLLPDLVRHHGFERRPWKLEPEIHVASMPFVDDRARGASRGVNRGRADQETGDLLDGILGRRKADAKQRRLRQPVQAEREMRPRRVPIAA